LGGNDSSFTSTESLPAAPRRHPTTGIANSIISDGAIETFDIGILLGLAWLDAVDTNPLLSTPRLIKPLMFCGALSQRRTEGLPRHSMICSKVQITRAEGKEKSISMLSASRLKSSMTLNSRKLRASSIWWCMKSID